MRLSTIAPTITTYLESDTSDLEVVESIVSLMKYRHHDEMKEKLLLIPFEELSFNGSSSLLKYLLENAYIERDEDSAKIIMEMWNDVFPEDDYLLGQTFVMSLKFPDDFYRWFVNMFPLIDYQKYVTSLVKYTSDENANITLNRFELGFGPQKPIIYSNIIDALDDIYLEYNIDLSYVRSYIKNLLSDVNVEAPLGFSNLYDSENSSNITLMNYLKDVTDIPFTMTPCKAALITLDSLDLLEKSRPSSYEKNIEIENSAVEDNDLSPYKNLTIAFSSMNILQLHSVKPISNNPLDLGSTDDTIINESNINNGNDNDISDSNDSNESKDLYFKVKPISNDSKLADVSVFNEEIEELIFRVLGPSFPPIQHVEYDPKNICKMYGGCRMLTCWEYENVDIDGYRLDNDDIDISSIEWYTGVCEYCDRKIYKDKKHCALRMPMSGGSWRGCFCSWDCVIGSTDDLEVVKLCEYFSKMYDMYGIFDRTWNSGDNSENVNDIRDNDNDSNDITYTQNIDEFDIENMISISKNIDISSKNILLLNIMNGSNTTNSNNNSSNSSNNSSNSIDANVFKI